MAFVALPVGAIADVVVQLLDAGVPLVTDVGSVKGQVVTEVARRLPAGAARFIGGHPMAGSEQEGVDGARADLFVGAAWVVTPTPATAQEGYATLSALLRDLQAEVVAVTPEDHDVLVSFVSHVPQLAASTLMDVATTHEVQHRALLRLAAGGFRDMTRIAASQPTIWLDTAKASSRSNASSLFPQIWLPGSGPFEGAASQTVLANFAISDFALASLTMIKAMIDLGGLPPGTTQ